MSQNLDYKRDIVVILQYKIRDIIFELSFVSRLCFLSFLQFDELKTHLEQKLFTLTRISFTFFIFVVIRN